MYEYMCPTSGEGSEDELRNLILAALDPECMESCASRTILLHRLSRVIKRSSPYDNEVSGRKREGFPLYMHMQVVSLKEEPRTHLIHW